MSQQFFVLGSSKADTAHQVYMYYVHVRTHPYNDCPHS